MSSSVLYMSDILFQVLPFGDGPLYSRGEPDWEARIPGVVLCI